MYCLRFLFLFWRLIITVRNSNCRKVMFSQASVCPQGEVYTPLGRHHPPPGRHPLETTTGNGWYASHWNAFLFHINFIQCFQVIKTITISTQLLILFKTPFVPPATIYAIKLNKIPSSLSSTTVSLFYSESISVSRKPKTLLAIPIIWLFPTDE